MIISNKGLCLLFVILLATQVNAADKVRLSVSSIDAAFMTAGVALKRGFFKEEGSDAEIIRMNVPNIITAPKMFKRNLPTASRVGWRSQPHPAGLRG